MVSTLMNITMYPYPYQLMLINRSLLCYCQLGGGNEFLHEALASSPSTDKVDRNMYFTINIAFAYLLKMNFPEIILPEDFNGQLTSCEPSFSIHEKIILIPQVIWNV